MAGILYGCIQCKCQNQHFFSISLTGLHTFMDILLSVQQDFIHTFYDAIINKKLIACHLFWRRINSPEQWQLTLESNLTQVCLQKFY
eukprot:c23719_g1_i3 orf=176-436(+)